LSLNQQEVLKELTVVTLCNGVRPTTRVCVCVCVQQFVLLTTTLHTKQQAVATNATDLHNSIRTEMLSYETLWRHTHDIPACQVSQTAATHHLFPSNTNKPADMTVL
jgi:hypothetical protein